MSNKTKEECLLNNGVMAFDLGKVEKPVMKAMDEYLDENKPKWIPVSEQLPEVTRLPKYLISYKKVAPWDYGILQVGFKDIYSGMWAKATHWMPLPENPTE